MKGIDPVTGNHEHADGNNTLLERPNEADDLEFSSDPHITRSDILAILGPDADAQMAEADVDVDELIRLVSAETTVLPPVLPADDVDDVASGAGEYSGQGTDATENGLATAVRTWKKRFLRGTVLAVMISLTGGGAAALAMNKSVTVDVDGEERTVHSFGDTVGEVLDDAGVTVGAHDTLSPSPQASVGDGGVITLERGRQLTLVLDGEKRESWIRATSVGEALQQLGLGDLKEEGAEISAPMNAEVPLEGKRLEVKTLKNITLFDGGDEPREVTTNAVDIEELLAELDLDLGPDDELKDTDDTLSDGAEVHISRTGVSVEKKTETIDPPVKEIEDDELEAGEEKVESSGSSGEKEVTYRVTKRNDEVVSREEISSETIEEAEEKVIRVGTKQPDISDGAVWDQLAECEATGDWSINSGNGYYGGLQFDEQTWNAYGGDEYAALPHEASREQQIDVATKVRDSRGGYGAWPGCSSQLGL